MLGDLIVIGALLAVALLVLLTRQRRSSSDRRSTAGHYDPDAIGKYTMDPATLAYRYELPDVAAGASPPPGNGPPAGRHRRRRRRPDRD